VVTAALRQNVSNEFDNIATAASSLREYEINRVAHATIFTHLLQFPTARSALQMTSSSRSVCVEAMVVMDARSTEWQVEKAVADAAFCRCEPLYRDPSRVLL
jgi:hypothetical protein